MDVDEDDDSKKYVTDLVEELAKQDGELTHIESFGFIH